MGKKYWLGLLLIWVLGMVPVVGAATNLSTDVMKAVNTLRTNKGRPVLAWNKQLTRSAQAKADDMAKNSYFAHENSRGVGVADLLVKNGYNYLRAGENLAYGYETAAEIVGEWSKNTEHRSNMLGDYIDTGIGVSRGFYDGREVVFVVQHFGSPSDISVSVKSNQSSLVVDQPEKINSKLVPSEEEKLEVASVDKPANVLSSSTPAQVEAIPKTDRLKGNSVNWLGVLLVLFSIVGAGFVIRSLKMRKNL